MFRIMRYLNGSLFAAPRETQHRMEQRGGDRVFPGGRGGEPERGGDETTRSHGPFRAIIAAGFWHLAYHKSGVNGASIFPSAEPCHT